MADSTLASYTAFSGHRRIAVGSLQQVALAVKAASDAGAERLLVFDDRTGRPIELDLRGSPEEVAARLPAAPADPGPAPAGRGRPKLGVTAREVTLMPSHWEWLATQPGGASAALRRLVDQARRSGAERRRQVLEVMHRVMFALAGDLPDFEEVTRALYAADRIRFEALTGAWPADVSDYLSKLSAEVFASA